LASTNEFLEMQEEIEKYKNKKRIKMKNKEKNIRMK
jgi:hypothetical protein